MIIKARYRGNYCITIISKSSNIANIAFHNRMVNPGPGPTTTSTNMIYFTVLDTTHRERELPNRHGADPLRRHPEMDAA